MFKGIAADGDVKNFCWNDNPSHPINVRKECREYVVDVELDPSPPARSTLVGTLSYDFENSFNESLEYFTYSPSFPTKEAKIIIRFSDNKRCLSAHARLLLGAGETPIEDPQILEDGHRLEVSFRPKVGNQYRIYWNW